MSKFIHTLKMSDVNSPYILNPSDKHRVRKHWQQLRLKMKTDKLNIKTKHQNKNKSRVIKHEMWITENSNWNCSEKLSEKVFYCNNTNQSFKAMSTRRDKTWQGQPLPIWHNTGAAVPFLTQHRGSLALSHMTQGQLCPVSHNTGAALPCHTTQGQLCPVSHNTGEAMPCLM